MTGPIRRTSAKDGARLKHADHARLWRMVEGAVVDALHSHPDYFTDKGRNSACRSITKRVVGQIVGSATEALRRGRLGDRSGGGTINAAAHPDRDKSGQEPPAGLPKAPPARPGEGNP